MLKFFSDSIVRFSEQFLPSPITITMMLTIIVMIFCGTFTQHSYLELTEYWNKGFWELLKFTMQMALVLVLGHALASTEAIGKLIQLIVNKCTSNATAVVWISVTTLCMGFLNWGLGLVFGAILVRKVGENGQKQNIPFNYPLLGAAGYSGLVIWHGGFSGSAPLTVATENHFLAELTGIISITETVLSPQNIGVTLLLLVIIPFVLYKLSSHTFSSELSTYPLSKEEVNEEKHLHFNDKLDSSRWLSLSVGAFILCYLFYTMSQHITSLKFFNLNFINMLFLGLGLILHKSLKSYSSAVDDAVKGIGGILLLFPFYAGIMGVMKYSGFASLISESISAVATKETYPLFAFISSGLVNLFVPSGGGQWAVQGAILVETSQQLGVSLKQTLMAFSYGDELTNMLQPFWALPLLGITKLKAKEIVPYSLIIMLVSIPIFIIGIYLY